MRIFASGFVILAFIWAAPMYAQVGQTEMYGVVSDSTGAVLPGVTVTATRVGVGDRRTAVSDSQGRYRFNQIPVGDWEIIFELAGFQTVRYESYELDIGRRVTLNVTMEVAGVQETITVQAEAPLIETTRSELSRNIQSEQVEELPVLGRNWMGFAVIAAGIKSDGSEASQDSAPKAGIGVGRQDKVLIDGADVNNRSTSSSVDIKLSKEVIDESQVKTNQFDAQLGQSGTSVTQAITKSGTDQFGGNAFFYFRDEALNAEDFFTRTKAPYRNEQVGGTIGGPIIRGKTHFFFNYERQNTPQTLSSNTGIPVFDAQVDGSEKRNLFFARVDHQISDRQRFAFRYNRSTRFQPHVGVGGNSAPGSSINYDFKIDRFNASLDSVLSGNLVNRFIFNYLDTDRLFGRRENSGTGHSFPSIYLGGARGGVGLENPDYWSLRDDVTVYFEKGGQHNLKLGGYVERAQLQGFFLYQTNGLFFYDENPADLDSCCASENQSEWDKSQFPIATRYSENLGTHSIESPQNIYSTYVQDDWTVNERLTLNLGLRYDLETGSLANNLEDALLQQSFENDLDNFQPRVGFAYDLLGDAQTVLRGGAGKFYSQAFLNIHLYVMRSNRIQEINVTVFNEDQDPNFNNDPLDGRGYDDLIGELEGVPLDVAVFEPGSKIPHVWSYSIGVAHQITPTIALQADFTHQRTDNQFRSVDTNLFYDSPNNRALPVVSGFFPELGGEVEGVGRPDPTWNVVRTIANEGRSRYNGLAVALDKRFTNNYSFGSTYLLSKNEDDFTDVFDYANNSYDLEDDYGTSRYDQRHRFTANWVWRLPHDFVFSGLLFAASGPARSATTSVDLFGTAPESRGLQGRPTCGLDPRFDAACSFLGVPDGTRVPRNPWRSDAVFRVDIRFGWRGYIRDRMFVEPTIEIFNVFNRENYDPSRYNSNLASSAFGQPGRSSNTPYLPRQIQLGIKFQF